MTYFRTNRHGKAYPINLGGMSLETFRKLQGQDWSRKQMVVRKQDTMLDKIKPNKVEVVMDPKNGYLPLVKTEWNLKG